MHNEIDTEDPHKVTRHRVLGRPHLQDSETALPTREEMLHLKVADGQWLRPLGHNVAPGIETAGRQAEVHIVCLTGFV